MPRKKPVVPKAIAAAPASLATETMDDALGEARERIVELEHRAERAEADTQRYIEAYNRQEQYAKGIEQGLLEKIDILQANIPVVSEIATPGHLPSMRWQVQQINNDQDLEVYLNILAHEGWNVFQIFTLRTSHYHVVARRET